MRLSFPKRCFLVSNQLLQVLDQIVQLRHLNVVLDHVTWIQEANSLDILFDCLIIFLLLEQLVSMFLNNLTLDLTREVCLFGDGLRLSIVTLLHQVVDLDVVLHRVQLDKLAVDALTLVTLSDVVDGLLSLSLLDLHINDGAVSRWIPVHSDLVLEVVDRQLGGGGGVGTG